MIIEKGTAQFYTGVELISEKWNQEEHGLFSFAKFLIF